MASSKRRPLPRAQDAHVQLLDDDALEMLGGENGQPRSSDARPRDDEPDVQRVAALD